MFVEIKNLRDDIEIWKRLKNLYHNTSESWILNLTSDLHNLKLSNNQEIAPHLTKLKDLRNELESIRKTLVEKEFVHIIIHNLPSSYQSFIRGLDTTNKIPTISVSDLTTKLLQEKQRLAKEREPSSDESHALVSMRISFQYINKFNDKTCQVSNHFEEKRHHYRFK